MTNLIIIYITLREKNKNTEISKDKVVHSII